MATLKEIATRAGVSITTVSDVLNEKSKSRRVAEATADRVRAVARELGYRPNIHGRALVQQRTYLIGALASSIHTSFYGGVVAGFMEQMEAKGFSVLLSYTHGHRKKCRDACEEMMRRGVEGLAFIGEPAANIPKCSIPAAATHAIRAGANRSVVCVDDTTGGRLAAEHLIAQGARKVALITPGSMKRTRAAESRLMEAEIEVIHCSTTDLPDQVENGVRAAFCPTDYQAAETVGTLMQKGISIPEQCAVVGYDDLMLASVVRPALTTIRQPKEEYGRTLADLLLELLQGSKPRAVLLEPELVVRESTNAACERNA